MITINFDELWHDNFLKKWEQDGPWSSWEMYNLAYKTEQAKLIPEFEGLQAPKHLAHLKPLPHQLEVAKNVIEKMHGKAILADEVGLGKTIEAGLILKEYMIRGLVQKVLILVPSSLVSQWCQELNQKFYIPAISQKKNYVWDSYDVIVSSLDTAKRAPHHDVILQQQYDMVIIDEAHKLKNHKTKNYEFALKLKKRFCLLLTATPVQNKVEEIFHLVSLLKPGHLGSMTDFVTYFDAKKRKVNNNEHLKKLINKVMIRNRRNDTGIEWSSRQVHSVLLQFSKEERELYDSIEKLKEAFPSGAKSGFSMLTLKREACSSKEAVYSSLKNMAEKLPDNDPLIEEFNEIIRLMDKVEGNVKAQKVLELVKEIDDKVIIFTEYRATQLYLQYILKQNGITAVPFRGGFKRGKKDWMKELFKNHAQVFIATEAGGEGINLQFCHHIINYDLPWNPMRLEQRIGRVHRLGQEHDVQIYNFAISGTIEEHILMLLYDKINLFEKVIGELDSILTKIDRSSLDEWIEEIYAHSNSEKEAKLKMENLSSFLQLAINNSNNENGDTLNAATGN